MYHMVLAPCENLTQKKAKAGVTCPYASLSFSAVSVQTAAVFLSPVVPSSQSYAQFSTAPAAISKPVAILYLFQYSVLVFALLAVSVSDYAQSSLHQLPQPD